METEKGADCTAEGADNPAVKINSIEPRLIPQIEAALEQHLPEGVDIDAFIEKIIDAHFDSPPPAEI
ncbi:MAG: hypothetical protein FWD58_07915 [Firmicutes bacterium]|nr:hypothetical protein [Bacillota bacterium]